MRGPQDRSADLISLFQSQEEKKKTEKPDMANTRSANVIELPRWILIVRGFQLLLAIIIMGVSAYGIYWVAFNSWGFAVFTALATMIIVLYAGLTSNVASCTPAYNYWAILALDIFGVIFWLSAMGALAATRAAFVFPTTINGCVNYGDGGVCYRKREMIQKRAVATYGYLNMMSATAGLSAIEMILFITTLTTFSIHLHRARKGNRQFNPSNPSGQNNNTYKSEAAYPMNPVAYDPPSSYPQQQQQQAYDPPQQSHHH